MSRSLRRLGTAVGSVVEITAGPLVGSNLTLVTDVTDRGGRPRDEGPCVVAHSLCVFALLDMFVIKDKEHELFVWTDIQL